MENILEDSRFTKYLKDPRYRQIPKHERKVKIDKRFQSMFKDEKFKVKYTVDKRGRPINETSTENLRKYYELESGESSNEQSGNEDEFEENDEDNTVGKFVRRLSIDNESELKVKLDNDKLVRGKLDEKTKSKLFNLDIDYARGEGILQSDSSSDEESSEEEEENDLEHEWGALDAEAGTTEESTKRIAVCNMDWDNIKASDIMVLLSSFLPAGGVIHKITIFPSEYGLQRMKEEEVKGPAELTEKTINSEDENDNANEEGSSYHMEKLRRYQLNRLKYFYALVECDSVSTADKLYSECDGLEYESSATKLDLRFVPDDITFDQTPRDSCTQLPDMSQYQPRLFTTTALQQVRVELTWDATAPRRDHDLKAAMKGDLSQQDLKQYLASSSEDEDEPEEAVDVKENTSDNEKEDNILKYKNLLKEIQEKEEKKENKDMEMEITWGIGVKNKAEELVKKKIKEDDKNQTPFEQLMEKKRERKRQKKLEKLEKAKKKQNNSDDESEQNSSDDIPSDVDMNDSYFAEEFNKPEFKQVKDKKRPKKINKDSDEEEDKRKAELELLLDDETDGKAHFSLKKIQEAESDKKTKKKKKYKGNIIEKSKVDDFEVDVNDDRFSALYNSHLYNIDPTDPNYKKTKNMEKIIQEKLKRRPAEVTLNSSVPHKKSKEDAELSLLVKNIKRKTNILKKSK